MTTTATRELPALDPQLPEDLLGRLVENAVRRELNRELPYAEVAELDAARFGALRVPREYGGAGASVPEVVREVVRLAEADSNIAHLYRGHFGFVESLAFQPESVQQQWYPVVASGQTVGNASTEKSGNSLGQLNTVLLRRADRWRLTGEKFYTTGTIFSDYTRVSAAGESREDGRRFAVVATAADGVTVIDDWDGFGQRLTGTGTTILDDVVVPDHAVLHREAGSAEAVHEAAFFQLFLLAVQVGIATAALHDAVDLIRRRTRTFNTSSGGALFKDDPQIQQVIGEMSAKVFAAKSTLLQAAQIQQECFELGVAHRQTPAADLPAAVYDVELAVERAHITVPALVLEVTQQLFQTVGASAVARTKALDRHWRNAQTVATHNPIVFRARSLGDHEINGTLPEGLNAIGDAPAGQSGKSS